MLLFSSNYERYIEIAFFHLFGIATILFILLHLLSVFRIQTKLVWQTLLGYLLLAGSHIFWYLLDAPSLKIFTSLALFIFVLFISSLLLRLFYISHAQ